MHTGSPARASWACCATAAPGPDHGVEQHDSWFGILAPAATPKAEVDRIHAALNKVLSDPVVQDRLTKLGMEPGTMSVADFDKLLAADWETSGALVKASGARIE